jgi:hypothetical protein
MIQIDVNDNYDFWFHSNVINEILSELINKNSVTINFNTEGPCAKTMGIYQLLENFSDALNIPHNNIEIRTHNQAEYHSTFKITKLSLAHSLPTVQNELFFDKERHTKDFCRADFKTFGCFVGRTTAHRLWISSQLYKNYKNQTNQTYHLNTADKKSLERSNLGIDYIISRSTDIQLARDATDFLRECPLYGPDVVEEYPITVGSNLNIDSEYSRFFLDIVSETYTDGNTFFPTEKTWRPIALKTPFLINGPVSFLKNLKKLGFKTFDGWWEESYDYDRHETRLEKMFNIIDHISKLSSTELNTMYGEMQEVLEHNYNNLYKITPKDFKTVFRY